MYSVLHVPKIREYWLEELEFSQIYNAMSHNIFESMKS